MPVSDNENAETPMVEPSEAGRIIKTRPRTGSEAVDHSPQVR